jgi:hypothetical protein
MRFSRRRFEINDSGYIEVKISYEDYSYIADRIMESRIITSTRTRPVLIDSEVEFIIPDWIYKLRNELSTCCDSLTQESYSYLLDLDGNELIKALICLDRSVSQWYDILKMAEDSYKVLISEDELNPLEIKSILPLCTALEFTLHIDSEFFMDRIWTLLEK